MFKSNLNSIHYQLTENFESVSVTDKKDKSGTLEITVKDVLEAKILVTKKELENSEFNFKYFSNPKDENSYLIERIGSVNNFSDIIKDIFEKKRFSEEYLKINK